MDSTQHQPTKLGFHLTVLSSMIALLCTGCSERNPSKSFPQKASVSTDAHVETVVHEDLQKPRLDPTQELPDAVQLVFGVYQTDKATELYRKFLPIIEMVQADMSERLDREVDIELQIFKTYEEGLSALIESRVDFVRFGPTPYVLAQRSNPNVSLLAKEVKKGKTTFKGVICVQSDSAYQTLADLRGTRFAFGNQNSTIGRYLSQAELIKAGIRAEGLASFSFLGQHDLVGKAVVLGDYDAGALKESTFNKLNVDGKLRKLHTFDNITKPWVGSSHLHPDIKTALRNSLLEADDEAALRSLKVSGFVEANDEDYQPVRSAMRMVHAEFGGLDSQSDSGAGLN